MSVLPTHFKAADWFAQVRSGEMDAATERSWLQWIENDSHQKAYEQCELAWELSAELRNSAALTTLLTRATRPKWRVAVWQIGLAASAVAVGLIAWLFLSRPAIIEYSTAVGEQRTVSLADGSTALLNTDSRVQTQFSRHLRRITLIRGEALFSVSHDPSRPFEVHALQGVTTAVGTQFDVESRGPPYQRRIPYRR
jgi:transmembrane sensor